MHDHSEHRFLATAILMWVCLLTFSPLLSLHQLMLDIRQERHERKRRSDSSWHESIPRLICLHFVSFLIFAVVTNQYALAKYCRKRLAKTTAVTV